MIQITSRMVSTGLNFPYFTTIQTDSAPTEISMDRVHGMTLDEVRSMKRTLAENREALDAAHAELRIANAGWNLAAKQVQLAKDKLDAVTRALEG